MISKVMYFEDDWSFDVLDKKTWNYLDLKENSNKYYTAEIHRDKTGKLRIFTEYGRIGQKGKIEQRLYNNDNDIRNDWNEIQSTRAKKGYICIDLAISNTGSNIAKKLINTDKVKKDLSKTVINKTGSVTDSIFNLVKILYQESAQKVSYLISGSNKNKELGNPLGLLSINQINIGRDILRSISKASSHIQKLKLSENFWNYIPKKFGGKVFESDILITNLQEQLEILDFYESLLKINLNTETEYDFDNQYKNLNCKISVLDKNSKEFLRLKNKIKKSESPHHNVSLEIEDIFCINQENAPKFDDSVGNVKELFHGSRSANIVGILSSCLKIPTTLGSDIIITGAMFGPGIYFADSSTKSSQYSCSKFGGTSNTFDTAFMFISDVALGNIKEEYNAKYYISPPKGYDSVMGKKGSSLIHNEYVVYKENRQKLKYLVSFKVTSKK